MSPFQTVDTNTATSADIELAASKLLRSSSTAPKLASRDCDIQTCTLQGGIDLVLWKGRLTQPLELSIHDDMHRISFSYSLKGSSQTSFDGFHPISTQTLEEGGASISFNPGRNGTFMQSGEFASVSVMVPPDVLDSWSDKTRVIPPKAITAGYFHACCKCDAELRATAHALCRALTPSHSCMGSQCRSSIWLLGQSLTMVGLILEANDPHECNRNQGSLQDQKRLLRARDRLLQDLSSAPTLIELARETGLSPLKLKRGFRALFNNSVYGLFQQERMQAARHRLSLGAPVLIVASDFGYTNASHFAAAFHKQFGVNPSAVKRAGRL